MTEAIYDALSPFWTQHDEELDWPLLRYVASHVEPLLDPVYEVAGDGDDGSPGYSRLLDPDQCPAEHLPYLAQWVGARLQPGWSEAQKRAEIKAPTTWRRGQVETFKTAIQATLTGTQKVLVKERTPEAHDIYCRTLKAETPDEARTLAVALENKVAGLVLDYEAFDGYTYADLKANYETYADVAEAFGSYGEILEAGLP